MRILPAIFFAYQRTSSLEDALNIVHELSALTHAHPISLEGCGIYYLIAAQILDGKKLPEAVYDGLKQAKDFYSSNKDFETANKVYARLFKEDFATLPEDDIQSYGYVVVTLEAAIWCLLNTDSYKSLVLKAVNLGQDTDTVGAVAGGIGGLYYGLEEIPAEWLNVLKKRNYLEDISEKFFAALTI
jgi:ADP-ribosylglycohydrolase